MRKLDEHALGVNVSEIEAPFELKDRSHEEVLNDVRKRLSVLAGANIEIGQPISHRIDAMLSGTQAAIAIKLFGTDLNRMFTIGNQIKNACQDIKGIADLNVEQQIERPELKIVPRRELLVRNGITLPEFNEFLAVNLAGETVSQVYEDGRAFNLVVKAADYDEISNLIIDTQDGRKVPSVRRCRHHIERRTQHHQPRERAAQDSHLRQHQWQSLERRSDGHQAGSRREPCSCPKATT